MKALLCGFCLLTLTGVGLAQRRLEIGAPAAIDVHVTKINWHPSGNALAYVREEDRGVGVGTYRIGDRQGQVLLHLNDSDTFDLNWLPGTPCLMVTRYHPIEGGKEAEVYLLNSKTKKAEQVFARQTQTPDDFSIDVDCSPLLLHAIVVVNEGGKKQHFVLPITGGQLRPSQDLDQAVQSGFAGPLWSVDGTAVFSNPTLPVITSEPGRVNEVVGFTNAPEKVGTANLILTDARKLILNFRYFVPTPPVGATVAEVVPANGVLRTVRFRGTWVDAPTGPSALKPKSRTIRLSFGQGIGDAESLWLVDGKDDPRPRMISPHAQGATLAPGATAIAYLVDSALFVRTLGSR